MNAVTIILAATLTTGVEIPETGVPVNDGGHQYTTRAEKRPAAIDTEALYLKWKWRTNLANPATGVDNDRLREGVVRIWRECGWKDGRENWFDVAARCFDFLVDNVAIGYSEFDFFPAVSAWDRHRRPMSAILWAHADEVDDKYYPAKDGQPSLREELKRFRSEGCGSVGKDFDHSAPDWDDIFEIGFPGMKARVDAIAAAKLKGGAPCDPAKAAFYRAEVRAAAAMMRFLSRLIAECEAEGARTRTRGGNTARLERALASLKRLREGPPETAFDLMNFTMVYFILSEPLNYFQVRTMGNIDRLWWPYYQCDLAAGRTTEAEFREDFRHFIWQFGSIDNYWGHPIYLGGVNLDGRSAYNPLSMILLDVVEREALPTPKFQLKFGPDTPDEIWWKALSMLRRHAPLVLMSEPNMMKSMKSVGLPEEDAKDLLIWGCFEYLPRARGNSTSASRITLVQPVVSILRDAKNGGFSAATFEDFKQEYFRRLHANTDKGVELVKKSEAHLAEINPALMLGLAVPSALTRGVEAFSLGYDYNYSTIAEVGFATAVDSLLAVKEFVYGEGGRPGTLSLAELGEILAVNWKGHEELRLRMRRSKLKWGCGNPVADALAKEVVESFTRRFVGKPNSRGGVFDCYGLNSRASINVGARTSATPDGRMAGDPLSKNMAPSIGAETEGVGGSIRSYGVIAPENFPCGSIYDIMFHPSLVGGEADVWDGGDPDKKLRVFRTIVERFFAGGGVAMNINVVSSETLRDAQRHPEKYENLQVRVAGWNIRWNDIPRKEQDDYIARIECLGN